MEELDIQTKSDFTDDEKHENRNGKEKLSVTGSKLTW
jgi:hypothetical protein